MKKIIFQILMFSFVYQTSFAQISFFKTIISKVVNFKVEESSINQEKFLKNKKNSLSIYENQGNEYFCSPFQLSMTSLDRLFLVDFEGHADYDCIELHLFNDKIHGQGPVVMFYYGNKNILDIHYSPNVKLEKEMYDISKEVNFIINNDIRYKYKVKNTGLEAYIYLKDKNDSEIEIVINENNNNRKVFNFLAPVGKGIEKPLFFPLFYMKNASLCETETAEVKIKIAGVEKKCKCVPLQMNGANFQLARYSLNPVLGIWNENYEGNLEKLFPYNKNRIIVDSTILEINNNSGHYEISNITTSDLKNEIKISFSPPVPDIINLKNNISVKGKFTAGIDDISGIIGGKYKIVRKGNQIKIVIHPTKGWQPMPGSLWVKRYLWTADITIHDNNQVTMKSKWIHKK